MRPFKAGEMSWTKSSYGKERCQTDEKKKQRHNFTPLNTEQTKMVKDEGSMRKVLYSILKEDAKSVVKALSMTQEEIDSICKQTVEQAFSKEWHNQRKGRVTASLFHRLASRAKTLQKNEDANVTALTDTLLGK
ncbi:hypothetical protein MAR_037935 [Mya arenaria]|uniref:Uncharacterized protein n=1 Tax=Mya arenaria TaxID=6604 RepID=A0ABY7FYT1_MYAAR|nr:hypothetical protein MAR_037935 [Mya arenaria]